MNYLFTICARAGSKGLRNKNIGDFNGIPLAYYSIAAMSLAAKRLANEGHNIDFALNTDSEALIELIEQQRELDILVLRRTPELSGDRVPKVTVIRDALLRAQAHTQCNYDLVIDWDLTAPLRTIEDVFEAIRIKKEDRSSDVVYSLVPARKNPYFSMAKRVGDRYEKVIHANYIARQDTPEVFDMNASIYVYEPRALVEKEATGFFNDNAAAVIMKDTGILDIDCLEDREMMEILAKYLFFEKYDGYKEIYQAACKVYENSRIATTR